MRDWVRVVATVAIWAVAAGPLPALAAKITLSGEVTYFERIPLPDAATLRVKLIDLTAPGMPTRVEAEGAIARPGQVPLSFTLNFDDRALDPLHQHAIVAEISSGLELWFRNATPYPVTPLAPEEPVSVVVSFVGRLAEPSVANAAAPVASEAAAVVATPASILDITWRAETIRAMPVAEDVSSTMSIAGDMRAGGKGGCNSYFAQAELGIDTVAFSAVAATRMACTSDVANAQEQAFFDALAAARLWRLDGDDLLLLDGNGAEVVRFARLTR